MGEPPGTDDSITSGRRSRVRWPVRPVALRAPAGGVL